MRSWTSAFAASLGLAGLGAAALWTMGTPDALLARNYGSALAASETSWSSLPRNIWLSGLSGGVVQDKVLAAGDTITINARDGRPQTIEITGLELVDGDRIGVPGMRFQLITGRTPGDATAGHVRFLFATDGAAPGPAVPRGTGNRSL